MNITYNTTPIFGSDYHQRVGLDETASDWTSTKESAFKSGWRFLVFDSIKRMGKLTSAKNLTPEQRAIRPGIYHNPYGEPLPDVSQEERLDEFGLKKTPPIYTPEEADKKWGIPGYLKFTEPVNEVEGQIIYDRKLEEMKFKYTLEKAEGLNYAGGLTIELGMALFDPINLAFIAVPTLGYAKYSALVERYGKTGARLISGAMGGVVGTALVEPVIYAAATQEKADYGLEDSMANIAFGGVLGGGLHVVGGAVADALKHISWDKHIAAFKTSMGQMLSGKFPSVQAIVNSGKPKEKTVNLTDRPAEGASTPHESDVFLKEGLVSLNKYMSQKKDIPEEKPKLSDKKVSKLYAEFYAKYATNEEKLRAMARKYKVKVREMMEIIELGAKNPKAGLRNIADNIEEYRDIAAMPEPSQETSITPEPPPPPGQETSITPEPPPPPGQGKSPYLMYSDTTDYKEISKEVELPTVKEKDDKVKIKTKKRGKKNKPVTQARFKELNEKNTNQFYSYLYKKQKQFYNKYTKKEKEAIGLFMDGEKPYPNDLLVRSHSLKDIQDLGKDHDKMIRQINLMDSAMEKSRITENIIVYRGEMNPVRFNGLNGVNLRSFEDIENAKKMIGSLVRFPQYLFTSIDKEVPEQFYGSWSDFDKGFMTTGGLRLKFRVPKGTKGIYGAGEFSRKHDFTGYMREIILNRNLKVLVTDAKLEKLPSDVNKAGYFSELELTLDVLPEDYDVSRVSTSEGIQLAKDFHENKISMVAADSAEPLLEESASAVHTSMKQDNVKVESKISEIDKQIDSVKEEIEDIKALLFGDQQDAISKELAEIEEGLKTRNEKLKDMIKILKYARICLEGEK